jgi:carbon-monoxide dehydrogenase large subunit
VDEEDLVFEDGRFSVRGAPGSFETIQDLAVAAYEADDLPPGMEPTLEATTFFDPPDFVYPFGTHVCVVEIDRETGQARLLRYVAVDDCGTRINPALVEAQLHGGIAQAMSQALFEEMLYKDDGTPLTTDLDRYSIASAVEVPDIETIESITPTPINVLGAKGIGEAGTIGALAAVANSVNDALRPLGVGYVDMPFAPEKLWRSIRASRARPARTRGVSPGG